MDRGLGGRAQQRLGPGQEDRARLGQPGTLRRAIQQSDAQLLLEAANLPAQRRLRDAQRRGRAAEVAVLGHHDEVSDEPQVEINHRRYRVGHAWIVTVAENDAAARCDVSCCDV
jgi:hypothetical protein